MTWQGLTDAHQPNTARGDGESAAADSRGCFRRRASLHVCEAAQELGPDLFGAALTLGSILVDLGELEMHAIDHAVPTLDHGVVICIPELIDHVLIDLDRVELGVDRRGRRFEGVLLLEVGAVARSAVGSSVVDPAHAVNARDGQGQQQHQE